MYPVTSCSLPYHPYSVPLVTSDPCECPEYPELIIVNKPYTPDGDGLIQVVVLISQSGQFYCSIVKKVKTNLP